MRAELLIDRVGIGLVALLTVVTLAMLGVAASFKIASSDLTVQAQVAHGERAADDGTTFGRWLAMMQARDVSPGDYLGLQTRAVDVDHRADRTLEAMGVVALAGLLVSLIVARPDATTGETTREANKPLASTKSNGMV
jgi:hypothetical protein